MAAGSDGFQNVLIIILPSLSSAAVAIYTLYTTHRHEIKRDERAARREYEYNARQKLYEDFQPILFKFNESCDGAMQRIFSLARAVREGRISRFKERKGWLCPDRKDVEDGGR